MTLSLLDAKSAATAINQRIFSANDGSIEFLCHFSFLSLDDVYHADGFTTHETVETKSEFRRPDTIHVESIVRSSEKVTDIQEVDSLSKDVLRYRNHSTGDEWRTQQTSPQEIFLRAYLLGYVSIPFLLLGTPEEAFGFSHFESIEYAGLTWIKCAKRGFQAEQALYLLADENQPLKTALYELNPKGGKIAYCKYTFTKWRTGPEE